MSERGYLGSYEKVSSMRQWINYAAQDAAAASDVAMAEFVRANCAGLGLTGERMSFCCTQVR